MDEQDEDPAGYDTFRRNSLFGASWAYRHIECGTYGVGYQTRRGARISSKYHVCETPQFNEYAADNRPANRAAVS